MEYEDGYHPLDLGAIGLICQHEILEQSVLDWGFGLVLPRRRMLNNQSSMLSTQRYVMSIVVVLQYAEWYRTIQWVQEIKYNLGG